MVIYIRDLVPGADTADQGIVVFPRVKAALASGQQVTVSFDGIHTATSSFVKTAFLGLLRDTSFDDIKRRLRIVDSTRQINTMVKSRIEREAMADA